VERQDKYHLIVEGVANTTGSAAGLTGTLNGDFSNLGPQFPNGAAYLGPLLLQQHSIPRDPAMTGDPARNRTTRPDQRQRA
jgi:hypothetical protein